jgi:hypothetical protein
MESLPHAAIYFSARSKGRMSVEGPDCVKTRMLGFSGAAGWLMKPMLCSDRFHQSANAQNAHDPFHVVGQDV